VNPAVADVCVYGGTASGVMAAVAAKREGKSVIIVEPARTLGGMVGGGIRVNRDTRHPGDIGGLTRMMMEKDIAIGGGRHENQPQFREAFAVEQDNQVTDNPDNPGGLDLSLPRLIPGAATRSRGFNVDVGGKVSDSLTLIANISYTDVRIVSHATLPNLVGTRPLGGQNVPPLTYSFAARYSIRDGFLRGLRLGLTHQYADKHLRIGGTVTATAVTVPFYSQKVDEWSAVVGYAVKKFKNGMRLDLSLNVANLFDRKEMTLAAYYPEGRTVLFTTGLRF
jgi:outer membrane receptor for ferric coprogen and ferric-rhodotorulic acid